MDFVEKWGANVDEAVSLALQEMKLSKDDVEVTVLEEPSRGFFGIGAKLAKVRVEKKKPAEPEKAAEPAAEEPVKEDAPLQEEKAEEKKERPRKERGERKPREKREKKPQEKKSRNRNHKREKKETVNIALDGLEKESLTVVEEHEALTFLKEITEKMDLNLDFTARTGEDLVYVEMSGEGARTVIGKRGQTLDAIQYLTSLVVNKDSEKYIKVVVDAENYRAKRQRTLEQLANRLAAKVVKTGKYVRLEPMNPYERKVIHATLQSNPDVVTRSEGEEPYRRVIIELKK